MPDETTDLLAPQQPAAVQLPGGTPPSPPPPVEEDEADEDEAIDLVEEFTRLVDEGESVLGTMKTRARQLMQIAQSNNSESAGVGSEVLTSVAGNLGELLIDTIRFSAAMAQYMTDRLDALEDGGTTLSEDEVSAVSEALEEARKFVLRQQAVSLGAAHSEATELLAKLDAAMDVMGIGPDEESNDADGGDD